MMTGKPRSFSLASITKTTPTLIMVAMSTQYRMPCLGRTCWNANMESPLRAGQCGNVEYKIHVTDADGAVTSGEGSFTVTAGSKRGFVRISPTDPRYFETGDGTYLPLVGMTDPNYDGNKLASDYAQLKLMGVNFVRSWWQSYNMSRPLFGASGWKNLTYNGHGRSDRQAHLAKLPRSTDPYELDSLYTRVSVKPRTNYRVSATIKTIGITVGGANGDGVRVHVPPSGYSGPMTGSNDWTTVSYDFTTAADQYEQAITFPHTGVTGGVAYCSHVSLRENLGGGLYGSELVRQPDFEAHTSYPPDLAWWIDRQLDIAAENGVYVRAVIEEKDDAFYSRIQPDGSWGQSSNDSIYASPSHACRTLQSYYWRYLIARYGYSTALHSIEFANEANPVSANRMEAVRALATYVNSNDPSKHLVSTSNWSSFPPQMWQQPEIGTADIHIYLGWATAGLDAKRLWPGWDGIWNSATIQEFDDLGANFSRDMMVKHGGTASLKMTVPAVPSHPLPRQSALKFIAGLTPGHSYRVSAWVKAADITPWGDNYSEGCGLDLVYTTDGGDFLGQQYFTAPLTNRTYDWQYISNAFTGPANAPSVIVTPFYWEINSNLNPTGGTFWIDDVKLEDLTRGIVLNYNGGFEFWQPESYDVVAGHCAYSTLIHSFQLSKPTVRGETAFTHLQRFACPYRGVYQRDNEDQLLVDDTDGVWWRKWVWSQTDPGGLYEIYWMPGLLMSRQFTYAKAYQSFTSDIALSNGHYKDVGATVSNMNLRVLGQKDLSNNRAHLWIDNAPYTWKAVVNHNRVPEAWNSSATYAANSTCGGGSPTHIYKSLQAGNANRPLTNPSWWQDTGAFDPASNPALPPPVSGTVTVSGLSDGLYTVSWWDTTTGTVTRTETIQTPAAILI